MTRQVVNSHLLAVRESCPHVDDLGHLQLSEVRCLTETQQVSREILDLVLASNPIQSDDSSIKN